MWGLKKRDKRATVPVSRLRRVTSLARGEHAAVEPIQGRRNASTAIGDESMKSSYEVTSEGRVEVNVPALMKSEAVQRIAKLAQEIAELSKKAQAAG